MKIIASPDLWDSLMFPEGVVERWLAPDGVEVAYGEDVVEVRIGERLHTLTTPANGRLRHDVAENDVIDPGHILGHVET